MCRRPPEYDKCSFLRKPFCIVQKYSLGSSLALADPSLHTLGLGSFSKRYISERKKRDGPCVPQRILKQLSFGQNNRVSWSTSVKRSGASLREDRKRPCGNSRGSPSA
jgi:hypothetical protein